MAKKLKLFSLTAVSATSTAAPLTATDTWVKCVTIQNLSSSANTVYIGNSAVTAVIGLELPKGASFSLDSNVNPGNQNSLLNLKDIYVRCTSAETATVRVLYVDETEI